MPRHRDYADFPVERSPEMDHTNADDLAQARASEAGWGDDGTLTDPMDWTKEGIETYSGNGPADADSGEGPWVKPYVWMPDGQGDHPLTDGDYRR